jgi:hypothetical protein
VFREKKSRNSEEEYGWFRMGGWFVYDSGAKERRMVSVVFLVIVGWITDAGWVGWPSM